MNTNQEIDGQGTNQSEALQIIMNLLDRGFDSSNEKLALALGRPVEEIDAWENDRAVIDEDVVMKVRGIALERKIEV